jgi:hypothetical protein
MITSGEFAGQLPGAAFATRLDVPSNAIGEQFWCVVGARESYARAIVADGWAGFTCSLSADAAREGGAVRDGLRASAAAVELAIRGVAWTPAKEELLVDLIEHEAQHQGQLIRYAYALGLRFPQSWLDRWALAQPR